MTSSPPRRQLPSALVLLLLAVLTLGAIVVLANMGGDDPGRQAGPASAADSADVLRAEAPPTPRTDETGIDAPTRERPRAGSGGRAEAPTPGVDGPHEPLGGGQGLPPVRGMSGAEERPAGAAVAPPSAEEPAPDEDAGRLVYAPDGEGIRAAVGGEREHLRECYSAWLEADPSLGGKVKVQFVIADPELDDDEALARIAEVKLLDTTLTGEPARFIEGCVMNVMASLRFDPPEGGKLVVSYPFIFASEPGR